MPAGQPTTLPSSWDSKWSIKVGFKANQGSSKPFQSLTT